MVQIKIPAATMAAVRKDLLGQVGKVDAKLRRALGLVALRVVQEMRQRIKSRASKGNAYRRGRKWHYASEPGKTPNTDTGNLISSIIADLHPTESIAHVRVMAKYARALELGSTHRRGKSVWRVAARPFVAPVLRDLMPWIRATIAAGLR
jgi:hypothetical protein